MSRLLFFLCMLAPISAFGRPSQVNVQHVRTILERSGDRMEATQFVRFVGPETGLTDMRVVLPLPTGASGARYREEENPGVSIDGNTMVVTGSVPPEGRIISYQFDLPIQNETLVLHQEFGFPLLSSQVISMWTAGEVRLHGKGFSDAEWGEASNGLQAMMISSGMIQEGIVSVRLEGLTRSPMERWRWVTLVLSIAFLFIGFVFWLRSRYDQAQQKTVQVEANEGT